MKNYKTARKKTAKERRDDILGILAITLFSVIMNIVWYGQLLSGNY